MNEITRFQLMCSRLISLLFFHCYFCFPVKQLPPEDLDRGCQRVLTEFCDREDEHVGDNVLGHIQHLAENLGSVSKWTLWQKISGIMSMATLPDIWCTRHQRYCQLQRCDIDISGFPCVDFSPSGKQLGCHGPTFPVILALLSWHRQRKTKLVFLENVPEFPIEILELLMSDLYYVKCFYLQPSDSGCEFLSRMRVFILLMLKGYE